MSSGHTIPSLEKSAATDIGDRIFPDLFHPWCKGERGPLYSINNYIYRLSLPGRIKMGLFRPKKPSQYPSTILWFFDQVRLMVLTAPGTRQ